MRSIRESRADACNRFCPGPGGRRFFHVTSAWLLASWVTSLAWGVPVQGAEPQPDRDAVVRGPVALSSGLGALPEGMVHLRSGSFLPVGSLEANLGQVRRRVVAGRVDSAPRVLLQFRGVPDPIRRLELAGQGIHIYGTVGATTYLGRVRPGIGPGELSAAGVAWVGAVYPEDKVPPRMEREGPGFWALRGEGEVALRVRYYPDAEPGEVSAALARCGAAIERADAKLQLVQVRVPLARWFELAEESSVRWIEEVPPSPVAFNDGVRTNAQADLAQASPYGRSGTNVIAGICDAGAVDSTHVDLAGRVVQLTTNAAQIHSTHVAGTLGGTGVGSAAAGGSDRQWRGVAPQVQMVTWDFVADPMGGNEPAIQEHGIVLSQNSWGFRPSPPVVPAGEDSCHLYGEYSSYAPDYDRIVRGVYGRPISVIFAAGNNRAGTNQNDCGVGPYGTVSPPATAKNILAVGAIYSDNNRLPSFSSWGPTLDGRLKPELVAPGHEFGNDQGVKSVANGGGYLTMSGTSMAAPVVSGASALLTEEFRALRQGCDPLPSTLKAVLLHTALDLGTEILGCQPGPDYASGYGRLQIAAALDQLRAGGVLNEVVFHGSTNRHVLTVPEGATSVKLTLVWDDPAGLENAAVTLVNDLDLVVTDPLGVRHYPWTLDPSQPELPAVREAEDHRHVIEQVLVDVMPAAGEWTVEVVGHTVAEGASQSYALAFTPSTIPVPPLLELEQVTFSDEGLAAANGNGAVDPGETFRLEVALLNLYGPLSTNVTAQIGTTNEHVTILEGASEWDGIPSGGLGTNASPLVCRVSKTVPCGEQLAFTLVSVADGRLWTNAFTVPVGLLIVTNVATNSFESPDVPRFIAMSPGSVSTNPVTGLGTISDVDVSVRIDHSWAGDVQLDLEHPDGTRLRLVDATGNGWTNFGIGGCLEGQRTIFDDAAATNILNGTTPFVGRFRPADTNASLAIFNGKTYAGTWRLHLLDAYADDEGTNVCWGLDIAFNELGYVCELFNRAPTALAQEVVVSANTSTNLPLSGTDDDEDPLVFAVTEGPAHGVLTNLDPVAGTVDYQPEEGFVGDDAFQFEVSDGYTNSTATVIIHVVVPTADLQLESPPGVGPVPLGSLVTNLLVLTNLGPHFAQTVVVTNSWPPGLSLSAYATEAGLVVAETNLLRWEIDAIAPGTTAALELVYQVDALGVWTNLADVSAEEVDPDWTNNFAAWIIEARNEADLAVSVGPSPAVSWVGQPIGWVLVVTNVGPAAAQAVEVRQPLTPLLAEYAAEATVGTVIFESSEWIWRLDQLEAGTSAQVILTARAIETGGVTNSAAVTAFEIDAEPSNNSAELVVTIAPTADLAVLADPGGPLLLRQPVDWSIVVTNAGPSPDAAVVLTAGLATNLTVLEILAETGSATVESGLLRWELGALPAGAAGRLQLRLDPIELGRETNEFVVSGAEADLEPANNVFRRVWEVVAAADLSLALDAATVVGVGEPADYTVTVSNAGPSRATAILVTNWPPAGVEIVQWEADSGAAAFESGALIWSVDELDPSGLVQLRVTGTGRDSGTWTNLAEVWAAEADPDATNNAAMAGVEVRADADVGVALVVATNQLLLTWETGLDVVVTNLGFARAVDLVVRVSVPEGLSPVSWSAAGGIWVEFEPFAWRLDQLEFGASASVQLVLRADAVGALVCQASVTAGQGDPDLLNNQAETSFEVLPAVNLGLVSVGGGKVLPDQEVECRWFLTNRSPFTASGVVVTGAVPAGLDVVLLETTAGDVEQLPGELRWSCQFLSPETNAVLTARVRGSAPGDFPIELTASGIERELDGSDNTSAVVYRVRLDTDVALEMKVVPASVAALDEVVFEIGLTNQGTNIAHQVVVSDALPSVFEWVEGLASIGTFEWLEGVAVWSLPELAPGEFASLQLRARPGTEGTYTNLASVVIDDVDTAPANDVALAIVDVLPMAELEVGGEGPAVLWLGRTGDYWVGITNHGPSLATNVVVTTTLAEAFQLAGAAAGAGGWLRDGQTVRWELPSLEAGSNQVLWLQLRALTTGLWTNVVEGNAGTADSVTTNNFWENVTEIIPVADLGLRAQGPPASAVATEFLVLLSVTNQGPSDATGVSVRQELDPALEVRDTRPANGTVNVQPDAVEWEIGVLPAGADTVLELVLVGRSPALTTNLASLQATEVDPALGNNQAEWTADVRPTVDLAVGFEPAESSFLWGERIHFSVGVTNLSSGPAHQVQVVCELGAGLSLLGVSGDGGLWQAAGEIVTWQLAELAADSSSTLRLVASATREGGVTNQVEVSAYELDPDSSNNTFEQWLTVLPAADLGLALVAPASLLVGEACEVDLWVTNAGPSDASATVDVAGWEAGWSLLSVETEGGSWTNLETGWQWQTDLLTAGTAAGARLMVQAINVGTLTLTSRVAGAAADVNLGNNDVLTSVEVLPAAEVSVRTIPGEATVAGQVTQYALVLTNAGPLAAHNLVLTNVAVPQLELVDGVTTTGTVVVEPGELRWEIAALEAGTSALLEVRVRALEAGHWTNTVVVVADEPDPDVSNNVVYPVVAVELDTDLAVSAVPETIGQFLGYDWAFSAVVTNQGPNLARQLRLIVELAEGLTLIDVPLAQENWHLHGLTLTCALPDLAAGESTAVRLQLRTDQLGWWTNRLSVDAAEVDPNLDDNAAEVAVEVWPRIELGLESLRPEALLVGQTADYWLTVSNAGPSLATGLVVTNEGVATWEWELADTDGGEWTNAAGFWRWEIPTLEAGSAATLRLQLRGLEVGLWTNRVSVSAAEWDGFETNNGLEELLAVAPLANLEVALTGVDPAIWQATSFWQVRVTNAGPSNASSVTVSNWLASGFLLVASTPTAGVVVDDGEFVRWDVGDLAAGAAEFLELELQAVDLGDWTNVAVAVAAEMDPDLANNLAATGSRVRRDADVGLSLVPGAPYWADRDFTYHLVVTNAGPHAAQAVELLDELGADVELIAAEGTAGSVNTEGSQIAWRLPKLSVGTTETLQVTLRSSLLGLQTHPVTLTSESVDTNLTDNALTVPIEILPVIRMAVSITTPDARAWVYDPVRYQISVTNESVFELIAGQLVETVPDGMTLLDWSVDSGSAVTNESGIQWDLGPLPAGASARMAVTLQPQMAGAITNVVRLVSPFLDAADPRLVAMVTTLVSEEPPLKGTGSPGRYTISWPGGATNYLLQVTDRLGPDTQWFADTNTPTNTIPTNLVEGRWVISVKIAPGTRYYRLRQTGP